MLRTVCGQVNEVREVKHVLLTWCHSFAVLSVVKITRELPAEQPDGKTVTG